MAEKQMDLMVRIRANGSAALKELNKVDAQLGALLNRKLTGGAVGGALSTGLGTGWKMLSAGADLTEKAVSALLAPLRVAGKLALGFGAAAGALGIKAVRSAGELELLKMRLEAVSGSQEEAQRIFGEAKRMATGSPFDEEALVQGAISLKMLGIYGPENLRKVGDAAAVTGNSIEGLAEAVGAMRARTFKGMGIALDMENEGESATIKFQDRMGRWRKIAAKGADDIRGALLSALDVKFSGGMDRGGRTFQGMIAGLKRQLNDAFSEGLGAGLMPAARTLLSFLGDAATRFLSPEKMKAAGEAIGNALITAADRLTAAFRVGVDIWKSGYIVDALGIVMRAAGEMLFRSFVEYLQAAYGIFRGLGAMIAAAFMEQALQLPGMQGARNYMVAEGLQKMTPHDRVQASRALGFDVPISGTKEAGQAWIRGLTAEQGAKFAAYSSQRRIAAEGLASFAEALPRLVENVGLVTREIGREAIRDISKLTGIDVGQRFAQYANERVATFKAIDTYAAGQGVPAPASDWLGLISPGLGEVGMGEPLAQPAPAEPAGPARSPARRTFVQGGSGAGTTININNLKVHSDRPGKMRAQLLRRAAGATALAAAV